MHTTSNYQEQPFLTWWILGGIGSWILTFVLSPVISLIFRILNVVNIGGDLIVPDSLVGVVAIGGLLGILYGGIIGFSIGIIQRRLLRNYLHWQSDYWLHLSVLGGAISGVLFVVVHSIPLYLFPIGIAQWFLLPMSLRQSWLWIVANFVTSILFTGIVNLLLDARASGDGSLQGTTCMLFIGFVVVVGLSGWVTGKTLLHLFRKYDVDLDEDIYNETTSSKSVWDDAI